MTFSSIGEDQIENAAAPLRRLVDEVAKTIVGQETLLHRMVLALLADGHLLIEGVPGLAKTTAVSSLAGAIGATFGRLQFTPDLLPSDLTGTQVYRPQTQEFVVQKGPVFANLILADEINRAPAKVQSALLEVMQERQVTIGGQTFKLEEPFLVLATQNPVEQDGTYPLPEAQVDRFLMKVVIDYPTRDEELRILRRMSNNAPKPHAAAVTSPAEILRARDAVDLIHVSESIEEYIVDLVLATRRPRAYGLDIAHLIQLGASPRATIGLTRVAKANALLAGRPFVTPVDVKAVAADVLRHRLVPSYEAEAEQISSDKMIIRILDRLPVPS